MKQYRNNGAKGAILDEYERAILELQNLIGTLSQNELESIVDKETKDPDCRSVQTILTHVVNSGYGYATYIRRHFGEQIDFKERTTLGSVLEYQSALSDMFQFNEQVFEDYPEMQLEEMDNSRKILVRWGQLFDIEQLMEHAIVHVLRHRRQIERFLILLR